MPRIKLICSAHRASGRCNSDELLGVLRQIAPDVVFEEIRASDFALLYQRGSVEAHAVTRYRDFKEFRSLSVDTCNIPMNHLAKLKMESDRVFERVEQVSKAYQRLSDENDKNVYLNGFRYLNSAACETTMASLSQLEDEVINGTKDQGLISALGNWRQHHEWRESEMVRNIYSYARTNAFDTGVFLVGAAHKAGILKEIEKYSETDSPRINWDFSLEDQIACTPSNS